MTWVEPAGQLVISGAQEVMVTSEVTSTVLSGISVASELITEEVSWRILGPNMAAAPPTMKTDKAETRMLVILP